MIRLLEFAWRRDFIEGDAEFYDHWNIYKAGLLLNWRACWVGVHWGRYNRRVCVNLLPCVTLWVSMPGGRAP